MSKSILTFESVMLFGKKRNGFSLVELIVAIAILGMLMSIAILAATRWLDKLEKDYYSHDQDILNCLFSENEISILPRNWNYYNISNSLKEDDYMQDEEKNNYFNLMCTPSLVSFVIKPWLRENLNCDFAPSYWQYLRASPYYDVVASKLNTQSISNNIAGKISYKLFGLLPLLKIKHNSTQSSYKLFGILPLIKIKRGKRDVISVLGLPMFRVQNKKKYKLIKFFNLLPIMKIS